MGTCAPFAGEMCRVLGPLAATTCFCKAGKLNEYRRYVSIVCPRGYEPRALPLRHAGEVCCVVALVP